jgi:hypothetical protein
MVLDHPEILLHTSGSENDIRCQVARRSLAQPTLQSQSTNNCFKITCHFWAIQVFEQVKR